MSEFDQVQAGIAALESQRSQLGDTVVDIAIASLRAKLASINLNESDQQLRQVTVLFVDIVGSTSLVEHLDPEDVHSIVDGALESFTRIVKVWGGSVLQYAGDSALAAFGAETAQEDDAERAVHAGLNIVFETRRIADEVRQRFGQADFNVRVGIHTGPVLLGGGVDRGSSIRGLTVHVAARMEQSAPAGRVRISQDTYRHIRGIFEVEAQAPLDIKGLEAPVATYLVLRANSNEFRDARRGVEGVETPMVGRDAEFSSVTRAYENAVESREAASIILVAEAGLGKSRLMSEFKGWAALRPEPPLVFQGRAHPQGLNQPYGLLRNMLCRRFEIQDSDDFVEASGKLLEALRQVLGERSEEQSALVGQLIGMDYRDSPYVAGIWQDGKQIRDRAFHALSQYFRGLCPDGGALVLLLDDLHSADTGSLNFIDHLIGVCADIPVFVLSAARPSLYEDRPLWGSGQRQHRRVELQPLLKQDSLELAESLLSRIGDAPPMLRDLLTGAAEGNPFYMEELLQMLIDDGVVVLDVDRWSVVPDKLLRVRLPPTLTGVLQARLDALPPRERAALQPASVVGYVFWDEALSQLDVDAVQALPALARKDLTHLRGTTAFEGTCERVFKHHALHQVTYESVLKRQRREQHRSTAGWLVRRSRGRVTEFASLIADHYERANESSLCVQYRLMAAEHALQRFALDAAIAQAERGLALSDVSDLPSRYAFTMVRCEAHARQQAREAQATALDQLEGLAEALDDNLKRSQAAERRAAYLINGGEYAASLPVAQQSLAWATGSDLSTEARAQNAMTLAMARLGRYSEAKAHAEAGLALARQVADRPAEANLLQNMGLVLTETGDSVGAAVSFEAALKLCKATGDKFGECRVVNNLADMCRSLGDYATARKQMLELIRLCQEVGIRIFEGYAHLNLALVTVHLGDPSSALEHAGLAKALLDAAGDRWAASSSRVNAGHAHLALGNFDAARMEYRAACESFEVLDGRHMALEPIAGLAAVEFADGQVEAAMAHVETILSRLDAGSSLDGTDEPLRIRLTCYRVLQATQDARAPALLNEAYSELQSRAAKIDNAMARDRFLNGISHHKAILVAAGKR